MGNYMLIYCCNCSKDVQAELVRGSVIYPHRPDLASKYFYKCSKCGEYVGCHKDTTRPLGCIPTKELRIARIKIHSILDPIWKDGKMKRIDLYKELSKRIGYTYHTGQTRSILECMRIYDIVFKIKEELN